MSLHRHAVKRDANEPAIVEALRAVGASVTLLSAKGVTDLLVGYRGTTHLLEVKLPAGPRGGTSDRTLTEDQEAWWRQWRGAPPVIVRSAEEALRAIGVTTIEPAGGSAKERV